MKKLQSFVLASALAVFVTPVALADAILTVVPPATSVSAGQTFTVGIFVTGPTVIHSGVSTTSNVTDLDAFQFDLAFNCMVPTASPTGCTPGAGMLSALSVSEGSFLPNGGANPTFFEPGSINNSTGEISFIGDVGDSGVTGSGTLVNVTFRALTTGTTDIAILANSDLQLYDSSFNPIVVDDSVTTSLGTETFPTNKFLFAAVTATPEPPSGQLMFLAAAVAVGSVIRTRRRTAQP